MTRARQAFSKAVKRDAGYLCQCLHYDPSHGHLTWRMRPRGKQREEER